MRFELNQARYTREDFNRILQVVEHERPETFVPFEDKKEFAGPLDEDQSHWNAEYFDTQMDYFNTNCSVERYQHLVNVRLYLKEKGDPDFVPDDSKAAGKL